MAGLLGSVSIGEQRTPTNASGGTKNPILLRFRAPVLCVDTETAVDAYRVNNSNSFPIVRYLVPLRDGQGFYNKQNSILSPFPF